MEGFKRRGVAAKALWFRYLVLVLFSLQLGVGVRAQFGILAKAVNTTKNATVASNATLQAAVLQAAEDKCVGVYLEYTVSKPVEIPPYSTNLTMQPYSFASTVSIINLGYEKLDVWELTIDFNHGEIIASADGVLFLGADSLPGYQTTNDTRIVGTTQPNLLTSIDTAHNLKEISTSFTIVGTEFGINGSGNPLPKNMSLVNKGYKCQTNHSAAVPKNQMWVCCTENATILNNTGDYLPRDVGDIIISYDVLSAFSDNYNARVSIVMNDPIGRLDNWNLSWTWTGGELIKSMLGGQVQGGNDQDLCVYGLAATQLSGEDFSQYQSCSPNPVIIDLDQYQANNPAVSIKYCCRNGTLLPDLIDPTKSRSDVQLSVMKLPPHTTIEDIVPPADWSIAEGYTCSQPVKVSPAEIDPLELHSSSAVVSWQVTCNATVEPITFPKKCCVSFSAFYNDSLVPCPTCSCGCSAAPTLPWNGDSCNPSIDALLLPYQAVLLPPSNRTSLAQQLASIHHRSTPDTLPCPDNCGVAINWHVYSDYTNGWSARITLFNWDPEPVVNWSTSIQLNNAMPGFQDAYSFNNTLVPKADLKEFKGFNNTLFMQGRNDYFNNYLIGKDDKDNPGKLQSVLSFDKKKTPGINVVNGDGFPSRVWFNGEECRIPEYIPTGDGWRLLPTFQFAIVIAVTIFLMTGETSRFL
ncbi:unnamed protein product [Calypogeia fissa]